MGIVLAAMALLVVIGLGIRQAQSGGDGQPTAEASGSKGASPVPTASDSLAVATPVPTMALRRGTPITATAAENGIRVTLGLDRDRIAYGERVWADVTVVNTGSDDVFWGHSGTCIFAAEVSVITQAAMEAGTGRSDWSGELGVLKSVTVLYDTTDRATGDAVAGFTPEGWVDVVANMGCTTDLVIDAVPPGGQLTYRAAWDAEGSHDVPMPPGDYVVEATFFYMGRGAPPEVAQGPLDNEAVRVDLPLLVDSPDVDYLGPGEAVDRVLENQGFLVHLQQAPPSAMAGVHAPLRGR